MPANWYIPSSASATLVVGLAKGGAITLRVAPAAEAGEIVGPTTDPVAIGVRNVGSVAGTINLRIIDRDMPPGETIWVGSITLAIDEFGWVYPAINYPMPTRDLRLRAEAYHDSIVDSSIDKTIILIVRVDTATTLTLEPTSIEPGGIYRYIGRLTRTDTGAGLSGMEIIARREGSEVGSGTTGADGNYDISATGPTAAGSFSCQAVFQGVVPFAASSADARLGVSLLAAQLVWVLVAASVGIGLVVASRM